MDFDSDEFSPMGVSRYVIMLLVGFIVLTILVAITINSSYETTVSENGNGNGIPLASADGTTYASITFTDDGDTVSMVGAYAGTTSETDIVLLLADNYAIYVREGQLHYYNGLIDQVTSNVTANIINHTLNAVYFNWLYFPDEEGSYRSYGSSVHYNIDDRVAGMASQDGFVAISMNDTVTSDNISAPVTVTMYDSQYGVNQIKYNWSD